MDISFKIGDEKFNYRVSAIIISNGRILAMSHDKPSEYYSLPGGRVMMEETAEQAMIREVREELGVSLRISRRTEGSNTHIFKWLELAQLKEETFYPKKKKKEIFNLPDTFTIRTESR